MSCRLCKKSKADQTGSHIISAFMLASQIGKRGDERSYLISPDPTHNYKENRKDADIKEDNLLCRDCEKKLSFIENIFSSEITNKIEVARFEQNFSKFENSGSYHLSCIRINPISFYLMIYSIIWRASISKKPIYKHFALSETEEEELRFVLDLFLPTILNHEIVQSQKQWEKMVEECQLLFSYFPLFVVKAENLSEKTGTFQFFDNISKLPYHIMIGEYIIMPFLHLIEFSDDFFDIKKKLKVLIALIIHMKVVRLV